MFIKKQLTSLKKSQILQKHFQNPVEMSIAEGKDAYQSALAPCREAYRSMVQATAQTEMNIPRAVLYAYNPLPGPVAPST